MKYAKILLILGTFLVCGYTNYYISDEDAAEKIYGRNKLMNLVEGSTEIYNLENDLSCKGMMFITQPKTDDPNNKKLQPGIQFARVKCTDDRVIELKWGKDNKVSGIDQYKKVYEFKQVKKKEYKNYLKSGEKGKIEKNNKPEKL